MTASGENFLGTLVSNTISIWFTFRYVGDEFGMVSVLKYDAEEAKLMMMPYYVPTNILAGNGFTFMTMD